MEDTLKKYKLQVGKNNAILRTKSKPIEKIDYFIKKFSYELIDFMDYHEGVGISAPQIGINLRIFAHCVFKEKNGEYELVKKSIMINPKILNYSNHTDIDQEGCLSLPNENCTIERPYSIKVSFLDRNGRKKTQNFEGINARIIQHEMDHLDGILIVDRKFNNS